MKKLVFLFLLVMASFLAWADNNVTVSYNGNTATVTVDDNVAQYLTVTQSGAHVSIVQGAVTEEIIYTLTGTSNDGEFYMSGSYKATIELNGLTLTNTTPVYSGAAVHIQNGKRINVKVITGTTNTLTDAASGSQKGCLYVKGHAEFKQQGTLNIVGNKSHGIKAGEYISVKNATINITSAVDDGLSCNQYFLMESGTLNISGTGDDGMQCDLDGDTSTGMTINHEDEDSGNIYVSGGNITINSDAIAAKGIKCQGDAYISGNAVINVTTTGKGEWDATEQETNAACGLSADGNINISGGTLVLTATGSGGKGMKCDNVLNISGGDITVSTTGGLYYNDGNGHENTNYTSNTDWVDNNYYSAPKGIKAGYKEESGNNTICYGGINISGGTIYVNTKGRNAEGIESKNYLNVTGGETTIDAYDDGINAAEDLYITGGYLYSRSSNNDGIDANGNVVIEDGLIYAVGAAAPEVAIDANSEDNKKFHFNGGILIAIGGLESGSTLAQTCYQTSSVSSNTWYAMTYGGNVVAFLTPTVSSGSGGGPGGGGPGGGGSSSSGLVVSAPSTPTLKSGVTVSNGTPVFNGPKSYLNATVTGGSSVSLSQYSSGGGGGSTGPFTVTASASPAAGGTVTGAGTYTAHSLCTLTATANSGYTFDNWTRNGSVASTDPTYSFYVTENATCVAYFTQQITSYTITATANPTNGGTVTGAGSYPSGSTATLKAIANTGYIFTNWTKDGSVVSTNASYSFTVSENASYVANFTVAPQYAITVTANPTEGGTVTGAGNYYQGASVTLTATANTGYAFINWTKNGAQVSTNPTCTFTVTAAGDYVANFETVSSHSITLVQTDGGTISANVNTAYPGDIITLTATANTGYFFSAWDVRDASNNSIFVTDNQFTMPNSDVTVSAMFVQGFTVTLADATNGTIGATPTNCVPGTTVSLSATPATGYIFNQWVVYKTGDVNTLVNVSGNSFEMPSHDVTVVGIFGAPQGGEVTIGSGTNTSSNLPTNVWYKYTTSQQIYTQAEVGEAGTITAVSFQYNGSATSGARTLDIYMTHTTSTTLSTWVAVTSASKVYTGTQTFTTAGWYTITLDTPFEYDGTSNIMVTVDDNTGSYVGSSGRAFYVYATESTRAIYNQSDSYNVTPMSPQTGNNYKATTSTNNSQIKFTKASSGASESLSVSPNALSDFTYAQGEGPSTAKTVTVVACTAEDVTITAPADYEISDEENGTYGSTLTLTAESKGNRDTQTYDFENGWQGWTAFQGTTGNSPNNWMHNTEYSGYTSQGQINLSSAGNNSSAGFMLSESYISATYSGGSAYGAVYPDNYLVSPQIQLGGSITFYAASRSGYPAEKFSVLVSESGNTSANDFTHTLLTVTLSSSTYNWNIYTVDLSAYSGMGYVAIRHYDCYDQHLMFVDDVTIVEGGDPVTPPEPTVDLLTANVYVRLKGGLDAGTYANETLSVATGDVTSNVSLSGNVTQPAHITQTLSVSAGWNWVSIYIDLNEVNGIAMLEEALGDYGVTIALQDDYAVYLGDGLWLGLEDYELTNAEMVMVEVTEDCTVTLEGPTADPSTVEITLNPGWTWFGFPVDSELELSNILVDPEPEFGDAIAAYYGGVQFLGEWDGDFDVLLPGQGYVYWNESNEPKTLVFQTGAKTSRVFMKK